MTDPHISGKYSELMATAAFIADGRQVALPYGNQKDWDLLVQETGREWLRVQVKTAALISQGGAAVVNMHRTYSVDDVDLLVAVYPPTGTMWKIPIGEPVVAACTA